MNVSLTDPAARWTAAPGGPAFYAYCTNYLIDVHAGVIVDVEATAAHRTEEVEVTKTMIERVEERFDLKPKRLIGDTAYGSAAMLGWLVDEKQIAPHRAMRCAAGGLHSPVRAIPSERIKPLTTIHAKQIVLRVHSSRDAAPIRRLGEFGAPFMSRHATSLGKLPRQISTNNRAKTARKWRCCLLTSSAS